MIDTHCHLTYDPLCSRLDDLITKASDAGVHRMICVGTTPEDAAKAVSIATTHAQIFATAGLHPGYSADWRDEEQVKAHLRVLLKHERVLAVGEMGLDKHYPDPSVEIQLPAFHWQLDLMKETGLPGVIHNRKATDMTLATLRESGLPGERFVFHCFTGEADELDAILEFDAMVSLTGIVTFSSTQSLAEATDRIPLDRLMIETDSPYLTPAPYRKIRTNEPCYVAEVAKFLAGRRGLSLEAFVANVDANAHRFFNMPE